MFGVDVFFFLFLFFRLSGESIATPCTKLCPLFMSICRGLSFGDCPDTIPPVTICGRTVFCCTTCPSTAIIGGCITKGAGNVLTTTVGWFTIGWTPPTAGTTCDTDVVTLVTALEPCIGDIAVVVFGGGGGIWLFDTIICPVEDIRIWPGVVWPGLLVTCGRLVVCVLLVSGLDGILPITFCTISNGDFDIIFCAVVPAI